MMKVECLTDLTLVLALVHPTPSALTDFSVQQVFCHPEIITRMLLLAYRVYNVL